MGSDENTRNGVDTVAETKKNAVKAGFIEDSEEPSDDVKDAAEQSNAHAFITGFTEGYSTDVGEGSIMAAAGKSSVSPLPAPWSRSPLFSCWTKRPPLWTLLLRRWSRSLSTSYRQVRLRLPSSSLTD